MHSRHGPEEDAGVILRSVGRDADHYVRGAGDDNCSRGGGDGHERSLLRMWDWDWWRARLGRGV